MATLRVSAVMFGRVEEDDRHRRWIWKGVDMPLLLRVGRVSVAIRRLVHHSWYGPAGERPSWAGTSWTGTAGQGQVQLDRGRHSWTGTSYSHETGTRPTGFSFVYKYLLVPSRIDSNKQCFHNQYMHTCLLRATPFSNTTSNYKR